MTVTWKDTGNGLVTEGTVYLPLLGRTVEVSVDLEEDQKAATMKQLESLRLFLQIPEKDKYNLSHELCLQYEYSLIYEEDKPLHLTDRNQIWNYVDIDSLLIPIHGNTRDRYIFLFGRCEWDEEHGLELLFKNERLLRVSEIRGLSMNEEWRLFFINE